MDLPMPPVVINDERVPDWLVSEAGDGYAEVLRRQDDGQPFIPAPKASTAFHPSKFDWPPPSKVSRTVDVEEVMVDGEWQIASVRCECGRKKGTGRECAHGFRALDAVQCHQYKASWAHPHWRGFSSPSSTTTTTTTTTTTSISATYEPPFVMSSSNRACGDTREEQAAIASLMRDHHHSVARAYGNSLCDAIYRGGSGPLDPSVLERFRAADQLLKWIQSSGGEILVEVVLMIEAKRKCVSTQARAACVAIGGAAEEPCESGGGAASVRNAWDVRSGRGGRAAVGGGRKAKQASNGTGPKKSRARSTTNVAAGEVVGPNKRTRNPPPLPPPSSEQLPPQPASAPPLLLPSRPPPQPMRVLQPYEAHTGASCGYGGLSHQQGGLSALASAPMSNRPSSSTRPSFSLSSIRQARGNDDRENIHPMSFYATYRGTQDSQHIVK